MILEEFKKYLSDEGKSENTIKSYMTNIKTYFEYLQIEENEFVKLHRMSIMDYKSYLNTHKCAAPKTINAKLSSIAEFNRFLIKEGINEELLLNKKDYIKIKETYLAPDVASIEEINQFRNRVLNHQNMRAENRKSKGKAITKFHDFKIVRDYAILSFLAFAGLRISECLDLRIDDFLIKTANGKETINTEEVIVRAGKGNKARSFIMLDEIVEPLKEYLRVRDSKSTYLFYSREDEKLDRTTINKIFAKYGDGLTPHDLRHFLISYLLNVKKLSIAETMSISGHDDPKTLMIYTHPDRARLREKLRRNY